MSLVIAHRGASGYAPENTMEAFRLAVQMGADGIELDVHLSSDGELVVIHDETVDRTTNAKGRVRDMTLAQLQQLDACNSMEDFRGARIPTLSQVLELIRESGLLLNIEIKTDQNFYPDIERKCIELVKAYGVQDKVIYSSFNHYTLLKARQLDKDARLGILYADILVDPWNYADTLNVQYLHPMQSNVYLPNFAEDARAAGYGVNLWTVDDRQTMAYCAEHNVNIITDYPDVALSVCRGK